MKGIMPDVGKSIHALAKEIFPICRSITGDGVRNTLRIIQREVPEVEIYEVPSGEKAFDWIVPKEWNIKDAYVIDPEGNKIIDFKQSNLHVVGYSIPVDKLISLDELQDQIYSLSDKPNDIP